MEFLSRYCWTWTILFQHKVPLRLSHLGPWIIMVTLKNKTFQKLTENGKNCLIKNVELSIWNLNRTLKTSSWRLKHRLTSEVCSNSHQSVAPVDCQVERASGGRREGPIIFCHSWPLGWNLASLSLEMGTGMGHWSSPQGEFCAEITLQGEGNGGVRGLWEMRCEVWPGLVGWPWFSCNLHVLSLPPLQCRGLILAVGRKKTTWCGSCSDISKNQACGMTRAGKEVRDQAQRTGEKDTVLSVPMWPCEGFLLLFMTKGDQTRHSESLLTLILYLVESQVSMFLLLHNPQKVKVENKIGIQK